MTGTTPASRTAAWLGLVGGVVLSLAAGAVGAVASVRAADFYMRLQRPNWAPPPWLFGPVWTVLYVLMGVAAWLVWRERGWARARSALSHFDVQLACNAAWTWLFFAWRRGELALADIVLLAALVVATMVAFARVRTLAAVLLVPYLLWVLFATALTASIWQRNPGLL